MLDALIANGLTHIFCLQHDSLKIERTVGVSCRLTIKMDWLNRTATDQQRREAKKENLVHFNSLLLVKVNLIKRIDLSEHR
jgi:hypothetical protein